MTVVVRTAYGTKIVKSTARPGSSRLPKIWAK